MRRWMIWLLGMMLALGAGAQLRALDGSPVSVALAMDNLFAPAMQAQTETGEEFSIEVLGASVPKRARRVLIYHTHTYEAYEQADGERYQETEKWRTADEAHNVVRVGEELAALLRGMGIEVVHDTTAFEPPTLKSAYMRSLEMLEARRKSGETYDLYIDLHRDAYSPSQRTGNTVNVGGTELARMMVLIGKGEGSSGQGFDEKPDWESNLRIAQALTSCMNAQAEGLCRDVSVKSGRYNQHMAPCCVLVEAGNNHNTLAQVLSAMPYLADAIDFVLESRENT